MQFKIKKTITRVTVLSALLPTLPWLAADAFAHDRQVPTAKMDPAKALGRGAYAYDSPGTVLRSGVTRECVATGTWTIEGATVECHPEFFASPLQPAPAAAAAAAPAAPEEQPAPAAYEAAQYDDPPPAGEAVAAAAAAGPVADFAAEGDADLVPVPSPDSFADDAHDDRMGTPTEYSDGEHVADDGIVAHQVYDDEGEGVADDGIVAHQVFEDDGEAAADDGIVAHQVFEDEGGAADDGIVARQVYDDEGAAADDGILARQVYDDEGATADDGIVARQFYDDDTGAVADDGILAREEYFTDEVQPVEDDEAGFPEFSDEAVAEEDAAADEPFAFQDEAEPMAQAEEPTPVVLPVTITLDAEALFDFDRSLVRSNDREKIDKLVQGLKGVQYDAILVVGHADRIGTKTYNQRLSERRAGAVKAYLVKQGVAGDIIQTEGRGELEPTDDTGCNGATNRKLIDCLQPDRRVEVTVTGQKPR